MQELIDKQASIADYRICGGCSSFENCSTVKNIPAVNRWIPCSERLPVLYVPVMILTDDGSYAIAHVTGNEDEYLWFGDGGHYSKDYVLFWMPLPEPPKEDET